MEPLTDAEREARVAERTEELYRQYRLAAYSRKTANWDMGEILGSVGGKVAIDKIRNGEIELIDLVVEMKRIYDDALCVKRKSGKFALAEHVARMENMHPMGFNERYVAWAAMEDVMTQGELSAVRSRFPFPFNSPRIPKKFWKFAQERGFKPKHDPRSLFAMLARMELEPEQYDVKRQRRQRSHRGEDRSTWKVSLFYSTALLRALSEATGIPQRSVQRILRDALYEMPLEWTLG